MPRNRKLAELVGRVVETVLLNPVSTLYARCAIWFWGGEVGRGLRVSGRPRWWLPGELKIGDSVRLHSGYANFVGANQPLAIWVGKGARIAVGNGCGISNTTIVCSREIDILEGTFVGGGCKIYDMDFHQLDPADRLANRGEVPSAPIKIGPRAFVGGHSIVLKGVTIGEAAVIGAGSVVTRDVPEYEIWAGVPARKIGTVARN